MFRAKTVLVLGAGASVDLGLPMGDRLLEQIRDLLFFRFEYGQRQTSGDRFIVDALRLYLRGAKDADLLNRHISAGHRISSSSLQAPSIDNLVDALEDEEVTLVAKMAIVRAIHQAESGSLCARMRGDYGREMDLAGFRAHWYNSLSKLLFENVRRSEVASIFDNLEIISFNYDRCLETYLPHSLANYYGLPLEEMQCLVDGLQIHRPYGIAGELDQVSFGGGSAEQLAGVAQRIRTFTEQVTDNRALDGIKSALEAADRIVFLGFAFHRQNVKLLECQTKQGVEILGTSLGISNSDCDVIAEEICTAFEVDYANPIYTPPRHHVELAEMDCSQFFRTYWRTLTAQAST